VRAHAVEWTDGRRLLRRDFADALDASAFVSEVARQAHGWRLVQLRPRRRVLDAGGDPEAFTRAEGGVEVATTGWGRNPELWPVLDRLLSDRAPVTVWSPACASGEEIYTLAMFLRWMRHGAGIRLLASDVDADLLAVARFGRYPAAEVERATSAHEVLGTWWEVASVGRWSREPARRVQRGSPTATMPRQMFDRFLARHTDGACEVVDEVRACVEFLEPIDVLRDPWPVCDVLLCRNVGLPVDVDLAALEERVRAERPPVVVVGNIETQMGWVPEGYGRSLTPHPHILRRLNA
jgi:hypothetical protein